MGISLVIPGRNCSRTIRPCLDAVVPLLQQGELSEIVYVDDGSTDDTLAAVQSYPVRAVVGRAGGPGSARNVGWRAAQEELIWFIDSDCVAEPTALGLLLPHLDDACVAGVGGSYANMAPESLLACLIHEEIVARHARMHTEVNFLGSFNVLYRRHVLQDIGGFDEQWFNGPGRPGAEDAELAYRIHAAGHVLHFEPRSRVGHFHPTNLRRYLRSQRIHGFWRANLHLRHPRMGVGDSYSSLVDNGQPLVAMLLILALPMLLVAHVRWLAPMLLVALALAQVPMTSRLIRRTRDWRYLLFVPMSMVRAFARGIGLSTGVLAGLQRRSAPG
jgi:glycosyltransferase involved in cell wall biosynthesis